MAHFIIPTLKINYLLMPNKMLEYCKTILQKISFSKSLFKKEYKKTFKYLNDGERVELKKWLKANVFITLSNEETKNRIASEVGVIRQNKNTTDMKLDEKPRIDPITIS